MGRLLSLLVLALVLGCGTLGGGDSTTRGGLQEEARADPGLPEGSRLGRSTAPGALGLRTIYFDYDDATLRADAKETLRKNAMALQDDSGLRVEIQGHCDERGAEEYNLALGQRRAETAKRYLVDLGVRASRVDTKTFGESLPAVRGHDERAWSKNRRGEFAHLP